METERPLKKPNLIEDEDGKLIPVPPPPEELYSCGKLVWDLSLQIHICRALDGQCGMETECPLKKPNLIEDEDGKLIPVPPPPEELYSCGKLVWEWYACEEEDRVDESLSDTVFYVLESHYNAIKAVEAEYDEIMRRKGLPKRMMIRRSKSHQIPSPNQKNQRDSSFVNAYKPAKGRWLCLLGNDSSFFSGLSDDGDTSSDCLLVEVKCKVCIEDRHSDGACMYLHYVPKGATVGHGSILVCKCCHQEGGHPDDDDWVGKAVIV